MLLNRRGRRIIDVFEERRSAHAGRRKRVKGARCALQQRATTGNAGGHPPKKGRGVLSHVLRGLRERLGGNVHVPDGHMGEIRVGHGQAVAANQAVKSRINPVSAAAVVRVLQNLFGAGAPDVERSRLKVGAPRETNFVHWETDAVLQAHALFGGFDGLPTFGTEQGNDLRRGNERVAGGNAGPGVVSEESALKARAGETRTDVFMTFMG